MKSEQVNQVWWKKQAPSGGLKSHEDTSTFCKNKPKKVFIGSFFIIVFYLLLLSVLFFLFVFVLCVCELSKWKMNSNSLALVWSLPSLNSLHTCCLDVHPLEKEWHTFGQCWSSKLSTETVLWFHIIIQKAAHKQMCLYLLLLYLCRFPQEIELTHYYSWCSGALWSPPGEVSWMFL